MIDHYYDDWKTGWYDAEPAYECKDCEEKEQLIDDIGEHAKGLVKQLYAGVFIDEVALQFHLDELCWLLKIPVPEKMLRVKKWHSITPNQDRQIETILMTETVAV